MKRAIFKLGTSARVESRFGDEDGFYVEFTPDWIAVDNWDKLTIFSLEEDRRLAHQGTRISVSELGEEAHAYFANPDMLEDFRVTVSRHYSLIIDKGFEVIIRTLGEHNIGAVRSKPFKLLKSPAPWTERGLHPFAFQGNVDGVEMEMYAGLYRPFLSPQEVETEEGSRGSSDDAGWTVACNDRVVIWKDKTRLTGWGEATVPNYHGQFIPITGIILLRSDDPTSLPLTTTKRGIDAASNVYLIVKDLMRMTTKSLTTFTNRWKLFPDERDTLYRESRLLALSDLRGLVEVDEIPMRPIRKVPGVRAFRPELPEPSQEETKSRINYLVNKEDLSSVVRHFYEGLKPRNEEVGKMSFQLALEQAKEAGK